MTMPEIKPGLVTTGTNTPGVQQSGAGGGAAMATAEHIPTVLLQAGPGGARSQVPALQKLSGVWQLLRGLASLATKFWRRRY